MQLHKIKQLPQKHNVVYLISDIKEATNSILYEKELSFIKKKFPKEKAELFTFNRFDYWVIICALPLKLDKKEFEKKEILRNQGYKLCEFLNKEKETNLTVISKISKELLYAFIEGIALSSYRFDKYKKSKSKVISKISIISDGVPQSELKQVSNLVESVFLGRSLINEPGSSLTATLFASIVKEECKKAGIKTEVFGKAKIKSLRMSGLLAVNQGSSNDPTFTVMEWKPDKVKNKKPYILVGKGVMFDTGGLSLKPPSAMEAMKSDMAGAAAVFSCIKAIALNKLNIHVIGLIPATDNIPGQKALSPGDIITMANGKTVEVLNTDAEGRLILADALQYADKYNPELVIDVATLTGSASVSIGKYGIVGMHTSAEKYMELLKKSGFDVYERIVELPMWEEYDKELESDIADIKNIGTGRYAGAITAGCFLRNFVAYPWIHLDIASMGFMETKETYLGKGGTAVGVRLLYDFLKNKISIEG